MSFFLEPFKDGLAKLGLRDRSEPTNSDRPASPASPPKKKRRKSKELSEAQREKELQAREKELQASEQAERIKIHQKLKQEEEYRRKANELRKIRQREEENRRKSEEYDKRKQRVRMERLRPHQLKGATDVGSMLILSVKRRRAEREKDSENYPSGRAQRQEHVIDASNDGFLAIGSRRLKRILQMPQSRLRRGGCISGQVEG